jgi:eukaryotic-like serine/threonine-protein kinase
LKRWSPHFLEPDGARRSHLVRELLGSESVPTTLATGTRIGAFRVLRQLGSGGMAVVYLAERADGAYQQQVALKLIRPDLELAQAQDLLKRERQALARLEHPAIARLLDGGTTDTGQLWFAMEWVQGERIDRFAAGLSRAAKLNLMLQVCHAVHFAHRNLLVHRDIKPSNILVTAEGQAKLLDFGIARLLSEEPQHDLAQYAMTPRFAAPEQQRGLACTTLTDVYQLGKLLQQLLLPPARSTSAVSTQTTPTSAEELLVNEVAPVLALTGVLARIVARACHENPLQRYDSAAALAQDLARVLADQPIHAYAVPAWRVLRLAQKRHRVAVLASALALLLLLGTVSTFMWRLQQERQRAELEAATSRQVSELLLNLFEQANPNQHAGQPQSLLAILRVAGQRMATDLAAQPQLRARLETQLGRIFLSLEDSASAAPLLAHALSVAESDTRIDSHELALRESLYADALDNIAPAAQVTALLERADARLTNSDARGQRLQRQIQLRLALQNMRAGAINKAITRTQTLLALSKKAADSDILERLKISLNLGQMLGVAERAPEAVTILDQTCRDASTELGSAHPESIKACGGLGVNLSMLGAHARAIATLRAVLAATEKTYGKDGNNAALAQVGLGWALLQGQDWFAAEQAYRTAIAIFAKLPKANDSNSVQAYSGLGNALYQQNQKLQALAAWQQMEKIATSGQHALDPDRGAGALKLANVLIDLRRCPEAQSYFVQAEQRMTQAQVPPEHPNRAYLAALIARCR